MLINPPHIREIPYSRNGVNEFVEDLSSTPGAPATKLLLTYPTVYVIKDAKASSCEIYIGESNDIERRTIQHLTADVKEGNFWHSFERSKNSSMYVIGHDHFNKSLTLDVENRLMLYLPGVEHVSKVHNGRANPQRAYYSQENFDEIFNQIWGQLRTFDKKLFPAKEVIRDSALFKASPFHKLTEEQERGKGEVVNYIYECLADDSRQHLVTVSGEAGAGKSVFISSLFYELFQGDNAVDSPFEFQSLNAYLLVNHDEQLTVFEQIAKKLNIYNRGTEGKGDLPRVLKPTSFINRTTLDEPVDVLLIDEAHLLWTQGKQSYRGKNQLKDLIDRAHVVVAVFDEKQIMATNQYWDETDRKWLEENTTKQIMLRDQMRIASSPTTYAWLRALIDCGVVGELDLNPDNADEYGYQVRIFEDPTEMHEAIKEKASTTERGLSRMLATYDWDYSNNKKPNNGIDIYWSVNIGDFSLPWNRETDRDQDRVTKRRTKDLAWAEKEHSLNEVGSTFTIQGFDLNYAGVILGPSVKYRDGKIIHDPTESKNSGAKYRRTMSDGTKHSVGEQLLANELNVLLTRGVNGLYIYATDEALREKLRESVRAI